MLEQWDGDCVEREAAEAQGAAAIFARAAAIAGNNAL
jgi:hypothetical protein